jgi:hypothetical protein
VSRVAVTREDGTNAGRFDWAKAARWSDLDVISNGGSGGAGAGEAVMLTAGGRWVMEHWTHWQGQSNRYEWITADEAHHWLLRNGANEAVVEYFSDLPDEVDLGGRPPIGGAAFVRLGDHLPAIDEFAARAGLKRAAAVRRLAAIGLRAVTLPPGMKPIVIECNVVTGRIEVDGTDDWADRDARWDFIVDRCSGASALGVTVEPWGENEFSMERATQAVRDLGYTIGEWEGESGGTWKTVVTGRA